MARSIHPLVQLHWTDLNACAASRADVPVNRYAGSTYTEFLRCFHGTPDGYAFHFTDFLPVLLETRIYRQNDQLMCLIHKLL